MGAAVDLHWIPLGAGGHVVRLNGCAFEALAAALARRPRADLFHAALVVEVDGARHTIEVAPSPDGQGEARGVVATGPVGARPLGRLRLFRYEVRCWRDGTSRTSPTPSGRPGASRRTRWWRAACSPSSPRCRRPCGGATSCARGRCGTPTRSSPGHSRAPAYQWRWYPCRPAGARPGGTPASRSRAAAARHIDREAAHDAGLAGDLVHREPRGR